MKISTTSLYAVAVLLCAFNVRQGDNVEFSCLKKNKASNTCHFNFVVDGAKYRFVDIGCRYERKKEDIIEMAKEGELALAKDWKIDCPEVKTDNQKTPDKGF